MKILIASHTYIVDINREKFRALAKLKPDIEIKIVVPKVWQPGGVQNKIIVSQAVTEENFSLVPIRNFSKNNQALLTFGLELVSLLREFKPDIIQVEQGAKSLAYAQFITLNRFLGLGAKNLFFTWWNLPYDVKFPLSVLEKYNLRNTHGLISGNQDGVDILREHGYNNKAVVLPQLGVDEKLFYPTSQPELASELGIETDEFIIGFVGRFVEEKGILTLIKAVAKLQSKSWRLLLLGRGNLKQTIISQAAKAGIKEPLIMIESVPHDQVPRYINLMDTLVLPSETTYATKTLTAVGWKEQFGHVLIEAMACKVPLVGSDSGEIPYVIGEAGMIFPEKDISALTSCLQQLMEQPKLAEKLGELGYQRAMQKYTNQALAQKQWEFYQELLN